MLGVQGNANPDSPAHLEQSCEATRRLIAGGDVDSAIELANVICPAVLQVQDLA